MADGERKENTFNEVRSMFSVYNRLSNAKSGLQEGGRGLINTAS